MSCKQTTVSLFFKILGAFAQSRRALKTVFTSVRLCACINVAPIARISMKFHTKDLYKNLERKPKFVYNRTKISRPKYVLLLPSTLNRHMTTLFDTKEIRLLGQLRRYTYTRHNLTLYVHCLPCSYVYSLLHVSPLVYSRKFEAYVEGPNTLSMTSILQPFLFHFMIVTCLAHSFLLCMITLVLFRVSKLPTCKRHGHQHRMTVTRGCIDTICLSWWWTRGARNM